MKIYTKQQTGKGERGKAMYDWIKLLFKGTILKIKKKKRNNLHLHHTGQKLITCHIWTGGCWEMQSLIQECCACLKLECSIIIDKLDTNTVINSISLTKIPIIIPYSSHSNKTYTLYEKWYDINAWKITS